MARSYTRSFATFGGSCAPVAAIYNAMETAVRDKCCPETRTGSSSGVLGASWILQHFHVASLGARDKGRRWEDNTVSDRYSREGPCWLDGPQSSPPTRPREAVSNNRSVDSSPTVLASELLLGWVRGGPGSNWVWRERELIYILWLRAYTDNVRVREVNYIRSKCVMRSTRTLKIIKFSPLSSLPALWWDGSISLDNLQEACCPCCSKKRWDDEVMIKVFFISYHHEVPQSINHQTAVVYEYIFRLQR